MRQYLRLIDKTTVGRYDVTPIFSNGVALHQLVTDLLVPFERSEFNVVAGIDALGFIIGSAMAVSAGTGFIPIRKGGKLPAASRTAVFRDYTGTDKCLAVRKGIIVPGTRVLLVDDWIETGAQIKAAIDLVQLEGGVLIGVAAINIDKNEATRTLLQEYRCVDLCNYAASDA
jgi:adenine phosphoribosyltransferase